MSNTTKTDDVRYPPLAFSIGIQQVEGTELFRAELADSYGEILVRVHGMSRLDAFGSLVSEVQEHFQAIEIVHEVKF